MAKITDSNGKNLWDGPSLLVPVDVEALVVSDASTKLSWACSEMDYTNAGDFEPIRPDMMEGEKKPGIGVTLHWALPDGLTHGKQEAGDKKIKYPNVPNRWLVVRFYDGKSKAWIIQSDFLGDEGSNSFLDPNSAAPAPTRIGRVWDAAQWPGEAQLKQENFLTAIGPGNPAFAAYTPNAKNVFSFYDDMAEIKGRALHVSYAISGWYSKSENDPLSSAATADDWRARLQELQWTAGENYDITKAQSDWKAWAQAHGITINPDTFSDNYPTRIICHGMVYKVNWLGENGELQSGVPLYKDKTPVPLNKLPKIAIANTAIDALAALVQYELDAMKKDGTGKAAAELLEAFNYNLLDKYDKPGGQFELYREVFKAWFAANDGEYYYYIEDTEKPDNPFIEPARLEKLVELNRKSGELNTKQHQLAEAQKNLYGNWWKKAKTGIIKRPKEIKDDKTWNQIKADLKAAVAADKIDAVKVLQGEINTLKLTINGLKDEVQANLGATRTLKENIGGRYHEPNDPVVLIYGAGRAFRHGEDGRFENGDKMLTRFTGQTISGLIVKPQDTKQPVAVADVPVPAVAIDTSLIPKESADLFAETFFFDTGNAEAIAKAACTLLHIDFNVSYTAAVAKQQTGAWNADVYKLDRLMVADAAGFMGTIPSKISVQLWSAPWAPLYMAWEINWIPTATDPAEALKGWKFNPAIMEYDWEGPISDQGITLRGNATITPNSAFVMQAQLEKYFKETGKFPALQDFLTKVSNWDFLSQSMSGLSDMLLALTPDQLNPPPADIAQAVGSHTQLSPIPAIAAGFSPIRAGHFRLKKVWVIDDFGQVFDAILGPAVSYSPVRGTGMETAKDDRLVQLPPRLTQNTRFNFDLMNGGGGPDTIEENQTVNPICGWLLPNRIDKGLSIYTPDGHLLGELILTGSDKGTQLRWDNAPGKNIPVGTPLEQIIKNPYLLKLVQQLLQRPEKDSVAAFIDFLETIDNNLWSVEPLGGRRNELVSVFIGRPLALVKARVQYELRGGLQYSQAWINSTKKVTYGYQQLQFPIQLGSVQNPQDGVLGYYFGDFTTFNSILKDKPKTGYITDNPVSLSFESPAKDLFILADPRGEMNAVSGILPVEVGTLPGPLVEEAMANMNVTFRTGPLITDPDKLAMPLPSEMSGNWSWIQHTGVTTWEEISDITQANQKPRFGNNYMLKDGWLKLSNALKDKAQ